MKVTLRLDFFTISPLINFNRRFQIASDKIIPFWGNWQIQFVMLHSKIIFIG